MSHWKLCVSAVWDRNIDDMEWRRWNRITNAMQWIDLVIRRRLLGPNRLHRLQRVEIQFGFEPEIDLKPLQEQMRSTSSFHEIKTCCVDDVGHAVMEFDLTEDDRCWELNFDSSLSG